MKFEIINKKHENKLYKTIYITKELEDLIKEIALENNTSFNNIVVCILLHVLKDDLEKKKPSE